MTLRSRLLAPRPLLTAAWLLLAGPLAGQDIPLPAPRGDAVPILRILGTRRDSTAISSERLPTQLLADVLWAADGVNRTLSAGHTTEAPGGSYSPLIKVLCAEGVFLYTQNNHALARLDTTDVRPLLGGVAATAPYTFVITSDAFNAATHTPLASIGTGLAVENILLACADRGLAVHFSRDLPDAAADALVLLDNHQAHAVVSIGYPAGTPVRQVAWGIGAGPLVPASVNDTAMLQILKRRRATRDLESTPFSEQRLAELAWSGLGISDPETGERTSPLVAPAHDIDIYVALATGIYVYRADPPHRFEQISTVDIRGEISVGEDNAAVGFIYVSDQAKLAGESVPAVASFLHAGLVSQNTAAYAAAEGFGEYVDWWPLGTLRQRLGLRPDQVICCAQRFGAMTNPPVSSAVAISATTGGSVAGPLAQTIPFGAAGTPVSATAGDGYVFLYWEGLPGGRIANTTLQLPNVTCPMNISAVFTSGPTAYGYWANASFTEAELTNPAISDPLADPDGAGVTNLERYAYHLALRGPATIPVSLGSTVVGAARHLTITFDRLPVAYDIDYVVEGSDDLATWTTIEAVDPGTPCHYTVRDTVDLNAPGATSRYLRVRVTQHQAERPPRP